ncbi:MAG: small multi-drug export protein [Firmicutes bacterium]|nr:small multi-drug export protein [Bacillota bacterium]MCL1954013.1 small multi-drug export protein [Bacillota bacterium]
MIHAFVEVLVQFLKATKMSNWLITMMISFLPIAELRLGIPIGMRLGLDNFQAWLFSFVGSSMAAPIVLICFVPILDKMSQTKGFTAISSIFTGIFSTHAQKLEKNKQEQKPKSQLKRCIAVVLFVAMPGPMTGVWGGAAVACLLKLDFFKSVISVVLGNLIASLLVLAFSDMFDIFLDYIIVALLILAAISILTLIFKFIKKVLRIKTKVVDKALSTIGNNK